jgi:ATP-dependent DNA helicase RecG
MLPPYVVVEYLHGKMKPKEKNEIMERFSKGDIRVLVSTTVVEVGVDVPNATVMLIENAERFGLAQLHQLRGRVGRGCEQSYCILMSNAENKDTKKRLEILNQSNDGFFIAGEDLKLRGPGDLFGLRQSGMLEFKMADIFNDAAILQEAAKAAKEIKERDVGLMFKKHGELKQKLLSYGSDLNL